MCKLWVSVFIKLKKKNEVTTVNSMSKIAFFILKLLEQDIANHKEKVQDVQDAAHVFKEAKHFMNKELQARAKVVQEK